ncbi:DNA gyrase subunit A [Erysipelothrix rhusiopathiae]|uniref:DNA gyrase subunit A n=1 Tax=Erysipelothrix rhusiopathiae ATCC 19414 TaxID=525280 RepID=E7FX39_ERYRH|nr:DNA gyrase subunit A [Erysipelothrix rhusiopathiae]AGN25008.1 DNA gyrase subunit A [Erysipelothrix rhusiopathiae SY1027]AWU40696.1 DNA gyrase subunit A [Erysipelothrix rhusiopathiae]EFY08555.1 DNA gyrase, A subunit [Erysipelothrix rhusiopathiae ATCC 19414]MCG4436441.1 DNA gyrase subunit A [Erysipelothrix rhusiopathiae]MCG4457458.1 DNA gyrase subunit A [Erysipelothrix rhusiopathiae]
MEDNTQSYDKIKQRNISEEMKKSFVSYAMSVIVSRALPDVRDGLKPVHRRILYAMNDLGMTSDKPYKKSARIVGEVIGKYHPHGDTAVYDSMVRMAQEFSYRYMLIDGHGNFGSIDGDGAAAMRYTEARMSKISMELIRDINKNTVDFIDNYDGEEREPVVLPSRFPNVLVNGGTGIAVGMATNIPPHNLGEVIDATIALIDNPDITIKELMEDYIFGPDFPTGALLLGRSGIKSAFETGRGSVVMRAKVDIEEMKNGKPRIIISEIPYQVNKATLVEKIATLVRDKEIDGITDLRDESNREGIRIVVELRREVQAEVVLNQLYRLTALQSSFGVNMLALVNGRPELLNLLQVLSHYRDHQIEIVTRRTQFELKKAEDRAHILQGLMIALDHIDEVISIIRSSKDDPEAITRLNEAFDLTEIQSKAVLDMQLRRLTGLQRDKVENEFNELTILIVDLKDILANHDRLLTIIKDELIEIKTKFGDDRRSEIVEADIDMLDEDLIPVEDIVVTMTMNGYIKRTTVDSFNTQNRGGKGVRGISTYDEDTVDQFIAMSTHDYLLLFTNLGKVYRIRGFNVPSSSRTSKGIPVVNLLNLTEGETVKTLVKVAKDDESKYAFFVTKQGIVKRVEVQEFESIRQNGKIAITLREDDELVGVRMTNGDNEIIIGGSNGKAVRFDENEVRSMGRTASGVIGFNVDEGEVVGIATDREGQYILAVTEKGYGKRTDIAEYRRTKRGAKGVKTVNITEKNGNLVSLRAVNGDEEALIISNEGTVIRTEISNIGIYGRSTIGVRLINVGETDSVSQVAILQPTVEEPDEEQTTDQVEPVNEKEIEIAE